MRAIEDSLKTLVERLTKRFVREKERAAREGYNAALRADRIARLRDRDRVRRQKLTIKDAAWRVMLQAYMLASDNGTLPANMRQIMYQASPLVKHITTGRCWTKSNTFTQRLLPDYMAEHQEETKGWDVLADARGHFTEPHSHHMIGIGTLEVRSFINSWNKHAGGEVSAPEIDASFPTMGPTNRYGTLVYIEKEGFGELVRRAQIAERFDVAIFSSKGESVTAARALVDKHSQAGVKVLVVHDFDLYGLLIAHWLGHDSKRYKFERPPNVIDLGLRLADVERMKLQSEPVVYAQKKNPGHALLKCDDLSTDEIDFLVGQRIDGGHWAGQRVELNAMTARQFVEWLEAKLTEHGYGKVVPDRPTLEIAWRRARRITRVNSAITRVMNQETSDHDADGPPSDLGRRVRDLLNRQPTLCWDLALMRIVEEESRNCAGKKRRVRGRTG